MSFLKNKKVVIVGVANNRSIAWGIAKQMHMQGAEIILTYVSERFEDKIKKIGNEIGVANYIQLDVTKPEEVNNLATEVKKTWKNGCDILVHSIAFAKTEEITGSFTDNTTQAGFALAHDISAYSLVALSKVLKEQLAQNNGSILTLSYLGSVKAVPNYNVMGVAKASLEACVRYLAADLGKQIRVNAISAGPIRTLAAAGIGNFKSMLEKAVASTPTGRNVTIEEVGNVAAFLCSDLASGICGEITYVDGGYNITVG